MRGARRAYITGIGCVGPHGIGTAAFLAGLRAGRSATRALSLFPAEDLPCRVAGEVPDFHPEEHLEPRARGRVARVVPMALVAAREALVSAGLDPDDLPDEIRSRMHVLLGSGAGCIEFAERQYAKFFASGSKSVSAWAVPSSTPGMLASEISIAFGLGGMSHVLSNGCTSATDALGYALDLVRAERADLVLTGGADACITPGVLSGYCNLRVVSTAWNDAPARASRPMSADRDGFVLGEGAWLFVVESEESARRREREPLAEIAGYGATCEAYHRVAMQEDGRDVARAIYTALHDAHVAPEDLDYVNLHGTGTRLNDRVETRALERVFAGRARSVPMSATKSLVGHPQGASGAGRKPRAGIATARLARQRAAAISWEVARVAGGRWCAARQSARVRRAAGAWALRCRASRPAARRRR